MTEADEQIHFEAVHERWQSELHAIHRACPIRADFTFFFDRSPDFFAWPRCHFEEARYAGIFDDDRLVGYGMFGLRSGALAGRASRFFYTRRLAHPARGARPQAVWGPRGSGRSRVHLDGLIRPLSA